MTTEKCKVKGCNKPRYTSVFENNKYCFKHTRAFNELLINDYEKDCEG